MSAPTPVAKELKQWRLDQGLSLAKAASMIGVTAPAWFDWEESNKCPLETHREALELLTGIAASRWRTAQQRKRLTTLRKRLGLAAAKGGRSSSRKKGAASTADTNETTERPRGAKTSPKRPKAA